MITWTRALALSALVAPVLSSCDNETQQAVTPAEPLPEPEFLRFVEIDADNGRLETAVATYRGPKGVDVALVAVVHIGTEGYYAQIQRRLSGYEAALYEMVARKGVDVSEIATGSNPISFLQRGLCRALGLAFQLDSIDYAAKNFVHADMTMSEFSRQWNERGELWKMFLRVMSAQFKREGRSSNLTPAALFEAVRSPDRKARLKNLLAREFAHMDLMLVGGESSEEGDESLLIGERNKAALRVLDQQIAAGRRRLAIFYGAAHMPDFHHRLTRAGYRLVEVEYLDAW